MAAKAAAAVAEADVDGGEEGAAPSAKRTLPLKLIAMVAAGLLVVGGGGGAAYYFFFAGKSAKHDDAKAVPKPVFLEVPDVLVNLSNPSGERAQFLKIKIVLEVPEQTLATQIQPLMPRVMDTFQTYLRELRPTDLDGSAGLYRLKEELTRRVNAVLAPNHIDAVLFKEIVVQ